MSTERLPSNKSARPDQGPDRARRRRGRPDTITEEIIAKFFKSFRTGLAIERCADVIGVPHTTLWDWLKRGREHQRAGKNTLYAQFAADFTREDAELEQRLAAQVQLAGAKDWHAPAWILERRYRDRWSPKLDLATTATTPPTNALVLTPAQLRELLREPGRR